jgi:hypothetical protein
VKALNDMVLQEEPSPVPEAQLSDIDVTAVARPFDSELFRRRDAGPKN